MNKKNLLDYLENMQEELQEISEKVWNLAEVSGKEEKSSELFRNILTDQGFTLTEVEGKDLANAFYAEYGSGSPVIAVLGEYDALPGLSQEAGTKRSPKGKNAPGHGCGHNLLGTAALGGVLAIKKYIEETGTEGTIRFYGCPEEETLVGKVKMIREGAFKDCDVALSWHPMNVNSPIETGFLANNSIKFRFSGTSAHAAQSPESGRSALDSVELMNVGANYLREHVIDEARIHYTITNAGGAPNIIPADAESWYFVRAPRRKDVEAITKRLVKVAEGAAMMTETEMEYEIIGGTYEILPNRVLFDLTDKNMQEIDPPSYTEEELQFAEEIQKSLDSDMVEGEIRKFISREDAAQPYQFEGVLSKEDSQVVEVAGSSDSGDVSWVMPMNFFLAATWPLGVPAHSWQATASSISSLGMKGMGYASKIFAGMMYDLLQSQETVDAAKDEFVQRTQNQGYVSPLDQ